LYNLILQKEELVLQQLLMVWYLHLSCTGKLVIDKAGITLHIKK